MTTFLKDTPKAIRDRAYQAARRAAKKAAKLGAVTVQTTDTTPVLSKKPLPPFAEVQAKGQRKVKKLWKTDEAFRKKMLLILAAARAKRSATLGKVSASAIEAGPALSVGAFSEKSESTPFAPWAKSAVVSFKGPDAKFQSRK